MKKILIKLPNKPFYKKAVRFAAHLKQEHWKLAKNLKIK